MKIKNTEEFRKELFKNLKAIFSYLIEGEYEKISYEGDKENWNKVTAIHDVLVITNTDDNKYYYLEVSSIDGEVTIWEHNEHDKFFTLVRTITNYSNDNKTVYQMEVAKQLAKLVY